MLVKYDLMIYKGKESIIFMFEMDHEIEFVEKFVGDFFDVKSCRRIRQLNDVSICSKLEGKYYDCNNINKKLGRPPLICENRNVCIFGEKFIFEFQIDDYNLFLINYEQLVTTIRENDTYTYNLVFCSSEDKWNKVRFVGEVFAVDGKLPNCSIPHKL